MKKLFSIVLLLSVILASPVHAQEILVGMDHFPPWKMIRNGTIEGIDKQLVTALLKEVGITPKFVVYPWVRALELIKSGEVDMLSGVLKRPEREDHMIFIEPPYKQKSPKVFYIRRGSARIQSYSDLAGKRIGIKRGSQYFTRFDQDITLDKHLVNETRLNLQKLVAGRIDTVLATESQADYEIQQLGLADQLVKSCYRYDKKIPVYFVISHHSPLAKRVDELTKAARKLRDNGTFARIIRNSIKELNARL